MWPWSFVMLVMGLFIGWCFGSLMGAEWMRDRLLRELRRQKRETGGLH